MKRHIIFLTLLISACNASAQVHPKVKNDPTWIHITNDSNDTMVYSAKSGSYAVITVRNGTEVATVLGQIENIAKKSAEYKRWYVPTSDCISGFGKLVTLKVNGDYDFEVDYVAKGKNIASGIGDTICGIYLSDMAAAAADAAAAAGAAAKAERRNSELVTADPPLLGSSVGTDFRARDLATVFSPTDTIYVSLETHSTQAHPVTLSVFWWYEKGAQKVKAGETSKDIVATGDGVTDFFFKMDSGLPIGKYWIDVYLKEKLICTRTWFF